MGVVFAYSVTVSLILTLAYGGYLLSRNGSAELRRTILLGIYAIALVITPLLLSVEFNRGADSTLINHVDYPLPDVKISTGAGSVTIFDILLRIYVGGAAVCTLLTLVQLLRIIPLLCGCKKQKIAGHTVYVHNMRNLAPFCIGNTMIVSTADLENAAIMIHEGTHISRHHSIDLCIAQSAAILCWYCPAVWHMRRELKLVHEFQADEAVLCHGTDSRTYCRLLVERAAGLSILAIANNLNHNNLKQRIKMMQTPRNERRGGKMRILFPVVAVVCATALMSVPAVSNAIGQISQSALMARGIEPKGPTSTFVIYGVDINQDVVKNGNFKLVSDFESGDINAKDVNGVILPRIGAIFCTDKDVLDRLTPGIRKYVVDGKVMSAKEFSMIPASTLSKVIVSGSSMNVSTRNRFESQQFNALETAINAENRKR